MNFHESKLVNSLLNILSISFAMGSLQIATHADKKIVVTGEVEKEGYKPQIHVDGSHCNIGPLQKSYGVHDRGKVNTWKIFLPEKTEIIQTVKLDIAFASMEFCVIPVKMKKLNLSVANGEITSLNVNTEAVMISTHKSHIFCTLSDQIHTMKISGVSSKVSSQLSENLKPLISQSGLRNEVVEADFNGDRIIPIELSGIGNKLEVIQHLLTSQRCA